MSRISLAAIVAAIVIAPLFPVLAAKTQVSPSAYKAAGRTGHVHGRSDGVFQEENTKAPYMIENGTPAQPLGAGYRETFAYGDAKGMTQLDTGTGGTCAGNTTTVPCLLTFASGVKLVWFPVVTGTIAMDMDATSLDFASDIVSNDGVEIVGGVLGASGRPFIIGEDPAFYFCATVAFTTVAGADDVHIGFRRAEPFNAVWDDYLDAAAIGNNAANIEIETIDDNAATTTTDTTQDAVDATANEYCVYVSGAGAVTYTIDGAAPTVTAAFSFDDGDPVIPVLHYLQTATTSAEADLTLWEVGYSD